jgi:putative addiction module killer protein
MRYEIYSMPQYEEWFEKQTLKSKFQIEKRLSNIKSDGHFGHIRDLGDGLAELKFNDGRRVYYTVVPVKKVILLLGGSKNGQDSDIHKAKNIIARAKEKAKR